jgi:hypothetical protein
LGDEQVAVRVKSGCGSDKVAATAEGALDNVGPTEGGGNGVVTGRVGGLDGGCVAVRVDEAGYDGFANIVGASGRGAECDGVADLEMVLRGDGGFFCC